MTNTIDLYAKTMGKLVRVTGLAPSDDLANARMQRDLNASVIGTVDSIIVLADKNDLGTTAPAASSNVVDLLKAAIARVELANREGNPILSAWLPDAKAAIAATAPEPLKETKTMETKHTPGPRPVHRCAERECPFFGQATYNSCRCHKTSEQLLLEQRDDMLAALKAIEKDADWTGKNAERQYAAMTLVRIAIAKAEPKPAA